MRKKLYRNLTALVLMFALAMGTLLGTTMDVMAAAQSFNVVIPDDRDTNKILSAGQNIIFESGDTITYNGSEKGDIFIRLCNGTNKSTTLYYGTLSQNNRSISFPDTVKLINETYINPKWKLASAKFTPETNNFQLFLFFELCNFDTCNFDTCNEEQTDNSYVPSHECNFQWVTTMDPQPGVDGLEEYKCMSCGMVKESQPIPAGMATVKNLYGFIKDAPANGTVTTDFGKLHTISDYLLKKMAERNDVTATIQFEYNNTKLQITFPAGTDYTPVLTDTDTMYGFYGVAAKLGLTVTERQ